MALTIAALLETFVINLALSLLFLFLYTAFATVPLNARVYFTKWFILDDKAASDKYERKDEDEESKSRCDCSLHALQHSFDWVKQALEMPERELIAHAGLDMVVYLRMFKLGVKIFVPVFVVAAIVLFPVNYTSDNLEQLHQVNPRFSYSQIDMLTIGNIEDGSPLLWVHTVCAWLFTIYSLYMMRLEYESVAQLRLDYIAAQKRAPNQFTVLVRQVPPDKIQTVPQKTAHFFSITHPDHYLMTQAVYNANALAALESRKVWTENKLTELDIKLERSNGKRPTHKTGCFGCAGSEVDSISFYEEQLETLHKEIGVERDRLVKDRASVMPAAFVSFRTRWAAAVAAQTQQSKDSTKWITTWAPEPRDVVWANLPINYLSLNIRHAIAGAVVFVGIVFYAIPVTFVQSLANLSSLEKAFPWLEPIVSIPFVSSFLEGFLPTLALRIFLAVIPPILVLLSTLEGYVARSDIHRAASGKYFYFMVVTVFLANVLTGSVWTNLKFYSQNPSRIPQALGSAVPAKATFFMTWTMLDAWTAVSAEVFMLMPLVVFHIRNQLLVRTPADRVKAMWPRGPRWSRILPQLELYFLLSLVYCVVSPLYLPFAIVYFIFGFLVYRNQFINVYVDQYELAGGLWPHFHKRIIAAQYIQQIMLVGVFLLKSASVQTIMLIPLLVFTFVYNKLFIEGPFEPNFSKYALEEAMRKDTIDAATSRAADPHTFIARAYLHPSLQSAYDLLDEEGLQRPKSSDGDGHGNGNGGSDSASSGKGLPSRSLRPGSAESGGQSEGSSVAEGLCIPLVPVKRHPRSKESSPAVGRLQAGVAESLQGAVRVPRSASSAAKAVEPLLLEKDEEQ